MGFVLMKYLGYIVKSIKILLLVFMSYNALMTAVIIRHRIKKRNDHIQHQSMMLQYWIDYRRRKLYLTAVITGSDMRIYLKSCPLISPKRIHRVGADTLGHANSIRIRNGFNPAPDQDWTLKPNWIGSGSSWLVCHCGSGSNLLSTRLKCECVMGSS